MIRPVSILCAAVSCLVGFSAQALGKDESGVSIDAPSSLLPADYANQVARKVSAHWFPPAEGPNQPPIVSFQIHADGGVSDVRISQSSRSDAADRAAIGAVQGAAPFNSLPETFQLDPEKRLQLWKDESWATRHEVNARFVFSPSPSEARAYCQKGDAYMVLKQYEQAASEYEKTSAVLPARNLGDAYTHLKEYARAGTAYLAVSRYLDAGEAFYRATSFAEAAAAYDKAWSEQSDIGGFRFYDSTHHNHAQHADALFRTGEVEQSANEFHKVASAFSAFRKRPQAVAAVAPCCDEPYPIPPYWLFRHH